MRRTLVPPDHLCEALMYGGITGVYDQCSRAGPKRRIDLHGRLRRVCTQHEHKLLIVFVRLPS